VPVGRLHIVPSLLADAITVYAADPSRRDLIGTPGELADLTADRPPVPRAWWHRIARPA
jgi:hypothetical protein